MIDYISLGKLLYNGKVSRSDTIVFPDRMNTKWWINKRTIIEIDDLSEVIDELPDVVVVGTGFIRLIQLSDEARRFLEDKGVTVIVDRSEQAANVYNEICKNKKAIGLFHLI